MEDRRPTNFVNFIICCQTRFAEFTLRRWWCYDGREGPKGINTMSAPSARVSLSLEQLLEAVDRLSPAQMREFERRMAARRSDQRKDRSDEARLSAPRRRGCRRRRTVASRH